MSITEQKILMFSESNMDTVQMDLGHRIKLSGTDNLTATLLQTGD